ncbi:polysaccharide biosynthesis C-terminal domain-containing protein [Lachnospiraceae bacterium 29-84]
MEVASRTKKSIDNVTMAVLNKGIAILTAFLNRTVFIYFMGEVFLGLNSLFTTILTVLSLSELGISSAITFHMYRPIREQNFKRLEEIVGLYRRAYRIIGLIMFGLGVGLIPLLPILVNYETDTGINIPLIFVLTLLRTVLSYLFCGYVQAVIEANQEQKVISLYNSIASILTTVAITLGLWLTHDYYIYLSILILSEIIKNIFLFIYSNKHYKYIACSKGISVSKELKRTIFEDIKSVFIFKITYTVGQSVDNIVISVLLGTVMVGYYGNYILLTTYIMTTITLIINSLGGSIGNLNAENDKKKLVKVFYEIDLLVFWLMSVATVCLFQLLNPFINLWLHEEKYILGSSVVLLICANNFVDLSLNAVYTFRTSLGLFKYGRYNSFFSGVSNLILSFVFGSRWGIEGILIATLISNFLLNTFIYPYYLFKKGFNISPIKYFIEMFEKYMLVIFMCIVSNYFCSFINDDNIIFLIFQGIVCCITVTIIIIFVYFKSERFKGLIRRISIRK